MKKLVVIGLQILAIAFTANAESKEPFLVKNLEGLSINQVMVSTSGGSIEVLYEAGQKDRIEVYVQGSNGMNKLSQTEIQARINTDYDLQIETNGNKISAMAKNKKNNYDWKSSLNFSFKVFVQTNVETELSTSGGSISLYNLIGKQTFRTSGGSLQIKNMKGELDGATSGGSISIENCNATANLSTSGGSITAKNSKGKLMLQTSGGSLNFEDLDGIIRASTSGGSIAANNISGELKVATSGGSVNLKNMRCNLDAGTNGGSMNVDMTALKDFVTLKNYGGSINLNVPANSGMKLELTGMKVNADALNNFKGDTTKESIIGVVNGGGTKIIATASSGKVNLSLVK